MVVTWHRCIILDRKFHSHYTYTSILTYLIQAMGNHMLLLLFLINSCLAFYLPAIAPVNYCAVPTDTCKVNSSLSIVSVWLFVTCAMIFVFHVPISFNYSIWCSFFFIQIKSMVVCLNCRLLTNWWWYRYDIDIIINYK